MSSQGLLFAEPSMTETDLWCELADGLDPARWAGLCRCLKEFAKAEKRLYPNPDSIKSRFKRLFCFDQSECDHLPLVCLGKLDTDSGRRVIADG